VHSYSTPKIDNIKSDKYEDADYSSTKPLHKSLSNQHVNNYTNTQFEKPRFDERSSINTKVEIKDYDKVFQKNPHVVIKNSKRNEPTQSEITHYNHAITNYVQSTAKMINKDQAIPVRQHDSYISTNKETNVKKYTANYKENQQQNNTNKKRSEDEIASQIVRDLMNVHMADKLNGNGNGQCDVKYY